MGRGFDFGRIGHIIGDVMDSDYMDIRREVIGKSGRTEVYSNVPCHISFRRHDEPDTKSVDFAPVEANLTIHAGVTVDIRNDDYIVAKKTAHSGKLLTAYGGLCGHPSVSQARKSVMIQMVSLLSMGSDITPLPE